MKPRRENGATLVSPMTSEVGRGSALMAALLFWDAHSACKPARTQITCLRDVSRLGERTAQRPKNRAKKQGRRRSIPSTTLPAPDIEIGSRHPVNFRMPGILTGMCEPVHKGGKKLRGAVQTDQPRALPRLRFVLRFERGFAVAVRLRGAGAAEGSAACALAKDCRKPSTA